MPAAVDHAIRSLGRHIIAAFKTAIFPFKCLVCDDFYYHEDRNKACIDKDFPIGRFTGADVYGLFGALMTPYLCPVCIKKFLPMDSPICLQCGMMFKSREGEDHLCAECLMKKRYFKTARAVGVYDEAMMALIHGFKYKEKVRLAHELSLLLMATFCRYWQDRPIDVVVPVPLFPARCRQRGFNQAYMIVKDWPAHDLLRHMAFGSVEIDRHVLRRRLSTAPQTGLGRKARIRNVKNAFTLGNPFKIKNKRILLVDDVYTTGATVNECAKLLVRGGAETVDVLTLARAVV